MELAAPKSRLVVACGARKAGVSSPCTTSYNGGRLDAAGVKWVESLLLGVRDFSATVKAVLAMGGGESARAKGGAWERVVEDGEVVVS